MYEPYVIQIICNNPQDLVKQHNLISIKNLKQYDGNDQEMLQRSVSWKTPNFNGTTNEPADG